MKQKKKMKQRGAIIISYLCLQCIGHISLWCTKHPCCTVSWYSLVLPPLVQTKWHCAALHENVILLLYRQRTLWLIQDVINIPVIQGGRPWEPKLQSIYLACVLKAIKSLRYAANVWTHLSEAYTSLSTLLAVAAKMKYRPPESHLAPNWAIVLLFSPFRLWLSLL